MEAQKSAPIWEESSEKPEFGQGGNLFIPEQLRGWRSTFSLNGKEAEEPSPGVRLPGTRDQGG